MPRARVALVTQNSSHSPEMNGPQLNGGAGLNVLDDHIYQRLLRERIIFLGSEVRDQNANAICAQLLLLSAEDPDADIFLHINSPGGSVSDIKIQAQQSLHIKKVLLGLIAEHPGQPVEQIENDADRDRWFTAEQALEYSLVDQVIKSAREAADDGRPAHNSSSK